MGEWGSNSFFTAAPTPDAANSVNGINDFKNGVLDDGVRMRRGSRLSALFCAKAAVLCRSSSSDHKNAMNDRDNDEDAAWEQV